MGDRSAIEWTDATWNPVHGCSKVSPGCAHCYAETLSLRYRQTLKPWTPENASENVILKPHKLSEPLKWRKPRMVFVNSMSDLFHELVPDTFILAVWSVMEAVPQHTFQILTKRPERMRALLGAERPALRPAPPYERRPVPGYDGYLIDTLGDAWSTKRSADPRRMSPDTGEQGHRRVTLYHSGGETDRRLIHRLVLSVFDRLPVGDEQACHRDGNPANNAIENLYWGTQADNWDDSKRHRTDRRYFKLTPLQVAELRIAALRGESAYSLGRRYGISDTQARNIIRGEQWGFKVLPSVWLGTSIENRRFIHRADVLRDTPAAVRFISAEPLLGPLVEWMHCSTCSMEGHSTDCEECEGVFEWPLQGGLDLHGIDWLIVGGESGPRCRPMREEWARDLRDLAEVHETAYFLKQLGGHPDKRGGGKAILDGRTWNEFPVRDMTANYDGQATA